MKGKRILAIGFSCLIIFIIIATYLWYLYFLDFNNDGELNNNSNIQGRLFLVDIKGVNATNEESKEDGVDTDGYFFRVDNRKTVGANYILYIEDTPYNLVNDGCSMTTTLTRPELNYQLKLNEEVIQSGKLSSISDNILDERYLDVDASNNYELKIWISADTLDYEGKHYHYKVTLKEV